MREVKINFYTDPLCCWSWAFDQHWRRLLHEFGDSIQFQYVMCGMIPDWNSYRDPQNSVSRPMEMGPVWMYASDVTKVKMKYSLWHEDPPSSSYPACIAVKTVGLQSRFAEDKYLFNLRKSLVEDGINISKTEVILTLAEELEAEDFDFDKFYEDWRSHKGKDSFLTDLQKARLHNIERFPTLTLINEKRKGITLVGYRLYEALQKAFEQVYSKME